MFRNTRMFIRLSFLGLLLAVAGTAAMSAHAQLEYVTNADGISVTITGYTNDVPNSLVIPSNINGLIVTAIGESAFSDLYSLTSANFEYCWTDLTFLYYSMC